jgi:hypothetical protein
MQSLYLLLTIKNITIVPEKDPKMRMNHQGIARFVTMSVWHSIRETDGLTWKQIFLSKRPGNVSLDQFDPVLANNDKRPSWNWQRDDWGRSSSDSSAEMLRNRS